MILLRNGYHLDQEFGYLQPMERLLINQQIMELYLVFVEKESQKFIKSGLISLLEMHITVAEMLMDGLEHGSFLVQALLMLHRY